MTGPGLAAASALLLLVTLILFALGLVRVARRETTEAVAFLLAAFVAVILAAGVVTVATP